MSMIGLAVGLSVLAVQAEPLPDWRMIGSRSGMVFAVRTGTIDPDGPGHRIAEVLTIYTRTQNGTSSDLPRYDYRIERMRVGCDQFGLVSLAAYFFTEDGQTVQTPADYNPTVERGSIADADLAAAVCGRSRPMGPDFASASDFTRRLRANLRANASQGRPAS